MKYSADALAFLSAMIESTLVVYIGVFARVSDLVRSGYCDNFLYKDNIFGASTHVSLISLVCVCVCMCACARLVISSKGGVYRYAPPKKHHSAEGYCAYPAAWKNTLASASYGVATALRARPSQAKPHQIALPEQQPNLSSPCPARPGQACPASQAQSSFSLASLLRLGPAQSGRLGSSSPKPRKFVYLHRER